MLSEILSGSPGHSRASVSSVDCIRTWLSLISRPLHSADGLQDQTTPYQHSLTLIRSLLDTLTTFPPLPSAEKDDKDAASSTSDDKRVRPKPEEVQAAMSLLAVQPLIPGKGGEGPEAWEELMRVEVGGWNEG